MSDYHRPPAYPKARKRHRCIGCWHGIAEGEVHVMQTGYYEGRAYRNRFHYECWDAVNEVLSVDDCFEPGELIPPVRVLEAEGRTIFREGEMWSDPTGTCWSVMSVNEDGTAMLRNGPHWDGGKDIFRCMTQTEGWQPVPVAQF